MGGIEPPTGQGPVSHQAHTRRRVCIGGVRWLVLKDLVHRCPRLGAEDLANLDCKSCGLNLNFELFLIFELSPYLEFLNLQRA